MRTRRRSPPARHSAAIRAAPRLGPATIVSGNEKQLRARPDCLAPEAGLSLGHLHRPYGLGIDKEIGMSGFDKRQDGFEKKFAHDEELRFKAGARRNKLLGLWAAEKLGKSGAEADAYAKTVVAADFEEAGDEDVFRKIRKDFDDAKVEQSDHQIRRTMDELMANAIEQIKAGV
jgi:hypothetical protein